MDLNSNELVKLRDRCGLLRPEAAWDVLQRLTWLGVDPRVIAQAIDDATQAEKMNPVT